MFNMVKVTIVGAGFVGATTAHILAMKDIVQEIVLVDIIEGVPQGKALDLQQSCSIENFKTRIVGSNSYNETKNSDIVVVTAGIPRKPGMSRDDLLAINTKIMASVVKEIANVSPNAVLIIVSNPLDAMVYVASEISKFPKHRIIGMAGILDTARYKAFIAEKVSTDVNPVYPSAVNGFVLGGHGDEMVPLPRLTTVKKKLLEEMMNKQDIESIIERTRNGGKEIVDYLKTGSAFFAPASSIVQMINAIVKDTDEILPCCAYVNGQYHVSGYFIGIPVVLGKKGVKKVIELQLTDKENEQLQTTVSHVKMLIGDVKKLLTNL